MEDLETVRKAFRRQNAVPSRSASVLETSSSPRIGTARVRHDPEPASGRPITDTLTAVSVRRDSLQNTSPSQESFLPGESAGTDRIESTNTQARPKRRRIEGRFERSVETGQCK